MKKKISSEKEIHLKERSKDYEYSRDGAGQVPVAHHVIVPTRSGSREILALYPSGSLATLLPSRPPLPP